MRITRIAIENFQRIKSLDLSLTNPITVVAGINEAGKSSLCDAIRLALTGKPDRVDLKKQLSELVNDSAKAGSVGVALGADGICSYTLPDGAWDECLPKHLTVPLLTTLLTPASFAASKADERRRLLFQVTGCKASTDMIKARMAANGISNDAIEVIAPLLRLGFPEACKDAEKRATEAKGGWRAITGETYGDKKAVVWRQEAVEVDESQVGILTQQIAKIDAAINERNQEMGRLQAAISNHQEQVEKRSRIMKIIASQSDVEAELKSMRADIEQQISVLGAEPGAIVPHETQPCPYCECDIEINGGKLLAYAPVQEQADQSPDAIAEWKSRKKSILDCEGDVNRIEGELRNIEWAKNEVGTSPPPGDGPSEDQLLEVQDNILGFQASRSDLQGQLNRLRIAVDAWRAAQDMTTRAAEWHKQVQAWQQVAAALAPDGIPGELLNEALTPVNDRLYELSKLAGWARVQIAHDMAITADGRPYRLQSESAQWRTDTIICIALSKLAMVGWVMLDRFDVLDLPGRAELIDLLDVCVSRDILNGALITGTMKQAPTGLPGSCQVVWLEKGAIAQQKVAA